MARTFGEISGIIEGQEFSDRVTLAAAGIHKPTQAGISYSEKDGADSIVLSGGYADDEDFGDLIVYTGMGGRDQNTGKPDCRWEDCPKSLDAGLNQVTVGLAWWYRKYSREQSLGDQGRYEIAEAEARASRVGLWADDEPMAPWEWRHGKNR